MTKAKYEQGYNAGFAAGYAAARERYEKELVFWRKQAIAYGEAREQALLKLNAQKVVTGPV